MAEPGNKPLMRSHEACVLIRDVSVSFKQGLELLTSYQTCWKGKQIQDLTVGVLSWVPEVFFLAHRRIFSDFLAGHYPGDI